MIKSIGLWIVAIIVSHVFISKLFSPEISGAIIFPLSVIFALFIYFYRRKEKQLIKDGSVISKKLNSQHSDNFNLDDGFLTLWESNTPIDVIFKADYETKSQLHKVIRYATSNTGYDKLFCLGDSDNQIIKIDEYDIETKFLYKSKRYDTFEDVLEQVIGFDSVCDLSDKRTAYLDYLQEQRDIEIQKQEEAYQQREGSKTLIYSFDPKEIKFSIFGDYFDTNLPPNNLRISLLCNGLYGYPDNKEILALSGVYLEINKNVNIRLNAIRTMITFDGKKYKVDDFINLAKTF